MWPHDEPRLSANPVRDLFDAAAQHYTIRVTCRGCRRARVFHAAALWWHFRRKGFGDGLRDVPRKFRCRVCGRRGARMELVRDEADDASLPLPDELHWKRELRRRR